MTKAEQKTADRVAYVARVRAAIEEAHVAAEEAFKEYARTAPRAKEGHIADACGGAYATVHKPSHGFRTALQELGETNHGPQGSWSISRFSRSVNEQSITASEKAVKAASDLLKNRFPEEDISYRSYID